MLTFRDLTFGFRNKPPLFRELNISFPKGKTLLLGPNGSGKSTLFAIAAGLIKSTGGRTTPESNQVSLLPQTIPVFRGLTVREQVAYAGWLTGMSSHDSWARSEELLEIVFLSEKANESAKSLSGGQLRRVGIASALMSGNSALLFDEPTAGLDLHQASNFYQSLASVSGDKCLVVSSHQIEGISGFFDNIALLVGGEIKFFGSLQQFIAIGTALGLSDPGQALVAAYSSMVAVDK